MELAKHIGPLAVVAMQLCLPTAVLAGEDASSATVVTVPVVDATEAGEVTVPAPPSGVVLPGAEASDDPTAAAPTPAPAVQPGAPAPTAANGSAPSLAGVDRRDEAAQRASSGRWLQIGKNSDPVRGRFRVNRSSAIVGLAVGF